MGPLQLPGLSFLTCTTNLQTSLSPELQHVLEKNLRYKAANSRQKTLQHSTFTCCPDIASHCEPLSSSPDCASRSRPSSSAGPRTSTPPDCSLTSKWRYTAIESPVDPSAEVINGLDALNLKSRDLTTNPRIVPIVSLLSWTYQGPF